MGLTFRVFARAVRAASGAGLVAALASLGMAVTTESRAVNLLVEPLTLLFVPGVAVAIVWTGIQGHLHQHVKSIADNHDFSSGFVVWCTFLIYFAAFFWWQARAGRPLHRSR
jgi:hypothetical protein